MLRFGIGLMLFALSLGLQAKELLCSGTAYLPGGQQIPLSTLARVDPVAGTISIKTMKGWATGPLGADPQTYMGVLHTDLGTAYWYNLDRYTGQAVWMPHKEDATPAKIMDLEFNGNCQAAQPMF